LELAIRLQQLREESGMDIVALSDRLGFSYNFWSAVEHNRRTLSDERLQALCDVLELDQRDRQELLDLRAAIKERGWWTSYSAVLSDDLTKLIGLEHGAVGVRTYESLVIPGLLQTEDYARALIGYDLGVSFIGVDQLVEVRMRRQQRLAGDGPFQLTALISEAALLQQTGGPDVYRGQLAHLATTIATHPDNVHVRVIPFTASPGGIVGSPTLYLLDFANPKLPTIAWQESITPGRFVGDPVLVRQLNATYHQALASSLSGDESLQLIQRLHELG
jgi:transcriptional regulator with XRE-family HTH domain